MFRDQFPLAFHERKELKIPNYKREKAGKSKNEREREKERERERERERITDTSCGSENETKKNEFAWMRIEPMAFGLVLRRSNSQAKG